MTPIRLRTVLVPFALAFALALSLLVTVQRASGDAGPPDVAALDAGLAIAPEDAVDPAPPATAPAPPLPADPVASPGDALDGFRLWFKTGWAWGVAFVLASLLLAASARIKYLRTGWRVVVVGTLSAMATVALTAKASGMTDAQAVAGTLYVAGLGAMWLLRKNASTVDLSTATPEQIQAALLSAGKPPAFPPVTEAGR
jgi:general stress protein CsbA